MLLFPSCVTSMSNVPLYFSYNHTPSICIIGLHKAKLLMHGSYAQKSQWNMPFPLTQVLSRVYVGKVSKITTAPEA